MGLIGWQQYRWRMKQLKVGLVCFPFIGLRIALYRASKLCPYECGPPALPNVLWEAGITCQLRCFSSTNMYFCGLACIDKCLKWDQDLALESDLQCNVGVWSHHKKFSHHDIVIVCSSSICLLYHAVTQVINQHFVSTLINGHFGHILPFGHKTKYGQVGLTSIQKLWPETFFWKSPLV